MSTPDLTAPVTAPLGWAKARPFVFFIFVLAVVIATIRFREKIASAISKIPVVGKWLTGIAQAAAVVLFMSLGSPTPRVLEAPPAPVPVAASSLMWSHGHLVMASSAFERGDAGAVLVMPGALTGKGVRS